MYISQLIRYVRAWSLYSNVLSHHFQSYLSMKFKAFSHHIFRKEVWNVSDTLLEKYFVASMHMTRDEIVSLLCPPKALYSI